MTFIEPGSVFVKWQEGQDFPKRYWPKGRVPHSNKVRPTLNTIERIWVPFLRFSRMGILRSEAILIFSFNHLRIFIYSYIIYTVTYSLKLSHQFTPSSEGPRLTAQYPDLPSIPFSRFTPVPGDAPFSAFLLASLQLLSLSRSLHQECLTTLLQSSISTLFFKHPGGIPSHSL
jgi:hypothetical protein